ncbi:MAG: hypothetical protein M1608_09070, partial [Candidatus Omnitrophica bacterium]|nr:hypothetical protein [Candidatus Omnitrophota bacterium]
MILDAPDPSTSQINRFYTAEFLAEVKKILSPGGVLSFALGHYENYVSPELARMLASEHRTLRESFAHVLMIPGGRIYFVASDGPLNLGIASVLENRRISTRLVKRPYLDATLSSDRLADLQRAIRQPASINKDLNPVLYYYYLLHWANQFKVRFGMLEGLFLILLGVYLARLRGASLALFTAGFSGSSLEIVLLLCFQAFSGSLYYQIGIVVSLFMAGLAVGAWQL